MEKKIHVPNHQPEFFFFFSKSTLSLPTLVEAWVAPLQGLSPWPAAQPSARRGKLGIDWDSNLEKRGFNVGKHGTHPMNLIMGYLMNFNDIKKTDWMDIKLIIPLHIQQQHLQLDYNGISHGNMTTIDGFFMESWIFHGNWDVLSRRILKSHKMGLSSANYCDLSWICVMSLIAAKVGILWSNRHI